MGTLKMALIKKPRDQATIQAMHLICAVSMHLSGLLLIASSAASAPNTEEMGYPADTYSQASPQDPGQPETSSDDTIIPRPPVEPPPPLKIFSAAETQKVCAKYQGKLLSVYGEVFKIKNCIRHVIQDQQDIFTMTRQGLQMVGVEASDVAAIPVGVPWSEVASLARPCSFFNKKYITFSYADIYYVDGCVRHLLPDYETFLTHSRAHNDKNRALLALNPEEFFKIPHGSDILSILDKEYSNLYELSANVDIIPIDEACRGTEGKIVMFYSRMYKIEKCHKREIDAESYTMHSSIGNSKILELRPEQWVSMPDGKPYPDKKPDKKPEKKPSK
jgi:hypothetical protein